VYVELIGNRCFPFVLEYSPLDAAFQHITQRLENPTLIAQRGQSAGRSEV